MYVGSVNFMYPNSNDMQPDCRNINRNIQVSDERKSICLCLCKDYTCIIGVKPYERVVPQKLSIEADIMMDKNCIGQNDWLLMVDNLIKETIIHLKPFLLERMAIVLGENIIGCLPKLSRLKLTIKKPQALPCAKHAYVCLDIEN